MNTAAETSAAQRREHLRELAETGEHDLGWDAPAEEVIGWVAAHVPAARTAVACSMADAVLPHLVAEQVPGVDVLFLDTGYHFPETLGTRDVVAETLDVNIVDVRPELTTAEQDERYGKDLFATDPGACCRMRKVEPLRRALTGYDVWFTGVRRDEAPTRTNTPLLTWDEAHGLLKANPVAPWSFDQLMGYAEWHGVPVNMLVHHGYPSIGCAPCTRPVAPGEDPRAGRWSGQAKTECGIHLGGQ
ncbi:phosphoadenylyl-sulfate reductase [Amycolatopsis sp. H6(2020)]|uniref:Adenosine 5'-phosphosulfate reductase n=1 Tax=Rothia kristinae TaxID=37923 RepID=A0A1S2N0V8_9MICC|nr:phosphoadenylyl-sulfate reductase [Rothia kristinae]MBE8526102.1 phosphoadenylyl-sulfate reductase [Amycolatopsis sp. H6(2020)]OIJ35663.1 phosphoadenosine phosphosulfate reductase [Rothia kristinae]